MSSAPPEARSSDPDGRESERVALSARDLVDRLTRAHEQHQRLLSELGSAERRFRALARRVWKVQEDERRRLARELHDGLGQVLTALKNELERLAAAGVPVAPERLSTASEIVSEALRSTRELSRLLRPSILDDLGLEPALRWLGRTLHEGNGFEVELALPGTAERLSPDVETVLFRVAQEALTNALKHSGAPGARLELVRENRRAILLVSDRGSGCDPARALSDEEGQHLGLRSLRDRVELHGGRFALRSEPGAGVEIRIELPDPGTSTSAEPGA